MGRMVKLAAATAAALTALGAPSAGANVVDDMANVCTGTATWNVNLAAGYADINVDSSTCKVANVAVDEGGNPHVNGADSVYSGGYRVSLLGINVTGTGSFAGTAVRGLGGGPVEVVSPNILNATLTAVEPVQPSHSTEEHIGTAGCGPGCYRTQVRWYHVYDRVP